MPLSGRLGDDGVAAGIQNGACWERVADAIDLPARDIDLDAHLIEDLEPFAGFRGSGWVVLDLVEDDDRVRCGAERSRGEEQGSGGEESGPGIHG